ncbi:MAG TPA: AraC family transcriptional regulator [Burkholderiaceae bacterium]|nr:AraC family transcriptional regulator [Burkholderiaceae bacterium]
MAEHRIDRLQAGAAGRDGYCRRIRVDADRVFYCGDLGRPSMRRSGAINVYVALEAPLRFSFDGGPWQAGECVVAQPYVEQRLACDGRLICDFMIEPESVDCAALPAFLRAGGAVRAPRFVQRVRAAAQGAPLAARSLDESLLDAPLPRRAMDPRIARVVEHLQQMPNSPMQAQAFAAQARLSLSRFLHLFKEQTGRSYRTFRAWKRARMLLPRINQPQNLARLAQDIGYPDSSHFSHSIRQYFGICPKDILAGCSRLQVVAGDAGGQRYCRALSTARDSRSALPSSITAIA